MAKPKPKNDLESPGYLCLNNSGQTMFDHLVIRPGTVMDGAREVYPLNDLARSITFLTGDTVPDTDTGYVPVNYIEEHLRRKMLAGK